MEDKKFTCCDCKKEFVWTVENQKFFKDNKIDKEPVRCRECAIVLREKRKNEAEKQISKEENKSNKKSAKNKPTKEKQAKAKQPKDDKTPKSSN